MLRTPRHAVLGSMLLLSSALAPALVQAKNANVISAINFLRQGAERTIRISGSSQPTFQRFTLNNPQRLVLDFVESSVRDVPPYASLGDSVVESIQVEEQGVSGTSLSRVMITFRDQVDFDIRTEGNDVLVALANTSGAAGDSPEPVATLAQADTGGETESDVSLSSAPRSMDMVGFRFMADVSRVFVRTNDKVKYSVRKVGAERVVIELQNTTIPLRNNERFLDTQYFASPVKLIQPESIEGGTPTVRVEIELKGDVEFREKQMANEIWVDFPNG